MAGACPPPGRIKPGETGWIQLELSDPVVAVRQDHYILRRPSPGETLGGGLIIDPSPTGRHPRYDPSVQEKLSILLKGTPEEVLLQVSQSVGPVTARELITVSRLEGDVAEKAVKGLLASGTLAALETDVKEPSNDQLIVTSAAWEAIQQQVLEVVGRYNTTNPLRYGIPPGGIEKQAKLSVSDLLSRPEKNDRRGATW